MENSRTYLSEMMKMAAELATAVIAGGKLRVAQCSLLLNEHVSGLDVANEDGRERKAC